MTDEFSGSENEKIAWAIDNGLPIKMSLDFVILLNTENKMQTELMQRYTNECCPK